MTIPILEAPLCFSLRRANNGLCQQDTSCRHTERQRGFYPHLAFLGLDEFADFTAEIRFHLGLPFFFLPEFYSDGIRFQRETHFTKKQQSPTGNACEPPQFR